MSVSIPGVATPKLTRAHYRAMVLLQRAIDDTIALQAEYDELRAAGKIARIEFMEASEASNE